MRGSISFRCETSNVEITGEPVKASSDCAINVLWQIDAIDFAFVVTKFTSDEDLVDGPPEDGCYIRGLFIGAPLALLFHLTMFWLFFQLHCAAPSALCG